MKVFILTEGGANIGFGHISRCLSLYNAFQLKNIEPLILINGDDSIVQLLKNVMFKNINWIKTDISHIIKNADIIIIDSYLADKQLLSKISLYTDKIVYIDDCKRLHYPKGIVVNGSIAAKELNYPHDNDLVYLLGKEFIPLRKEFWSVPKKEIADEIQQIMITFGGDDIRALSLPTVKLATHLFPNSDIIVVISKNSPQLKKIQKIADNSVKYIHNANAAQMRDIMLHSDIAISAAGQTLYELAVTGTPVIAVKIIENQNNNIAGWIKYEYIEYCGNWDDEDMFDHMERSLKKLISSKIRKEKSMLGKQLISAQGSRNIIESILLL